jgi:hypothetical protein
MIPFHNNTDHMPFNEAPIAVPGITFTNWPDNYIHTTADDLWNIDRTQLQRNAFAVATMAYTIARAGNDEADDIAGEVYAGGSRRLAEAFAVATRLIREKSDRARAFWLASNQIDQAVWRNKRAVSSIEKVAPNRNSLTDSLANSLEKLGQSFHAELAAYYRATTGESNVPDMQLTESEKELQKLIPEMIAGPADFLGKRREIKEVDGLHGLMAFEIMNFIDGQRTALDIYLATVAEALDGGADYYGTVSPEQVGEYLQNLADMELVRLNGVATN